MTFPNPADTRSKLREHLAWEVHDSVAGDLQAMLVEMELLSRREGAPSEMEVFRAAAQSSLARLRGLLREPRDLPIDDTLVQAAIDGRVATALETKRETR